MQLPTSITSPTMVKKTLNISKMMSIPGHAPVMTKRFDGPTTTPATVMSSSQPPATLEQLAGIAYDGNATSSQSQHQKQQEEEEATTQYHHKSCPKTRKKQHKKNSSLDLLATILNDDNDVMPHDNNIVPPSMALVSGGMTTDIEIKKSSSAAIGATMVRRGEVASSNPRSRSHDSLMQLQEVENIALQRHAPFPPLKQQHHQEDDPSMGIVESRRMEAEIQVQRQNQQQPSSPPRPSQASSKPKHRHHHHPPAKVVDAKTVLGRLEEFHQMKTDQRQQRQHQRQPPTKTESKKTLTRRGTPPRRMVYQPSSQISQLQHQQQQHQEQPYRRSKSSDMVQILQRANDSPIPMIPKGSTPSTTESSQKPHHSSSHHQPHPQVALLVTPDGDGRLMMGSSSSSDISESKWKSKLSQKQHPHSFKNKQHPPSTQPNAQQQQQQQQQQQPHRRSKSSDIVQIILQLTSTESNELLSSLDSPVLGRAVDVPEARQKETRRRGKSSDVMQVLSQAGDDNRNTNSNKRESIIARSRRSSPHPVRGYNDPTSARKKKQQQVMQSSDRNNKHKSSLQQQQQHASQKFDPINSCEHVSSHSKHNMCLTSKYDPETPDLVVDSDPSEQSKSDRNRSTPSFTSPSLSERTTEASMASPDTPSTNTNNMNDSADVSLANSFLTTSDDAEDDDDDDEDGDISEDTPYATTTSLSQKNYTAEQLQNLIEKMKIEFEHLRTQNLNAKMKASILELDLASMRQERDSDRNRRQREEVECQERDSLRREEKARYERLRKSMRGEVDRLEEENTKLNKDWSRAITRKNKLKEKLEVLENENRRLKNMLSKQQQSCRCGRCGDEGKGDRHDKGRDGYKGGYVDLHDKKSRDLSSLEEEKSRDGSMNSVSSATAVSFIGPSLVSPLSQQHSSSHRQSSSSQQASCQPQSVNVQLRRKDDTSNHYLLSNSLPQAPSSWHGRNKKHIPWVPAIAPPLTSGTKTNTSAPPPPPPRRHGGGKGDRHFLVELNDTRSRDSCGTKKTKSRDSGSMNSFLSAVTTTASSISSKTGSQPNFHRYHSPDPHSSATQSSQQRPSSSYSCQEASPSQRTQESPRQDSWHPQPVNVRSRKNDNSSSKHHRRLPSNSLPQAPASWHGGNSNKKKSMLKMPRMCAPPPLTGSAATNSAAPAQSKTRSPKDKFNLREDEKGGIIDSEICSPSHSLDGVASLLEGLMREDDTTLSTDGSARSGW